MKHTICDVSREQRPTATEGDVLIEILLERHREMHTGFYYIILTLLTVQGNEREVIPLKSEIASLSLAQELISNTVSIVYLQSSLLVKASERDFSFNLSSNSQLKHIRYPQSYRATLLQVSSLMHQAFSNTYTTMYRIQLASKRIPDHVKTILRLLSAGSSTMIKRMLPTSFNSITRISRENELFMSKTVHQWNELYGLLSELKQLPLNVVSRFNNYSSDRTDVIPYDRYDRKNVLEKICIAIEQIQNQFHEMTQLILNLNIESKLSLPFQNDIRHLLPILYHIENNAHVLHQVSSLSANTLNRYILDQTAGIGKYALLSTDKDRDQTMAKLSVQLTKTLNEIKHLFTEREDEFKGNHILLQQMYEKLFTEFQDRSSTANLSS